jgi:hypothetical protein
VPAIVGACHDSTSTVDPIPGVLYVNRSYWDYPRCVALIGYFLFAYFKILLAPLSDLEM